MSRLLPGLVPIAVLWASTLASARQGIDASWIEAHVSRLRSGRTPINSWAPTSLATQGPWLVVGQPFANNPQGVQTGAVFIYHWSISGWELAELFPPDGGEDNGFGGDVAISGDTLVVGDGADDDLVGSAYVYTLCSGVWTFTSKIVNPSGQTDAFGAEVAIDGDTIVVGATIANSCANDVGYAEVYVRDDNGTPADRCDDGWSMQAHLVPAYCNYRILFGHAMELDGDRLVISAPGEETPPDDVGRGSVYVFQRAGSSWNAAAHLTQTDLETGARFGGSIDLDGERLLVGTENAETAALFRYEGSQWVLETRLFVDSGGHEDRLGWAVALDGDLALVGAPGPVGGHSGSGSVFLFAHEGAQWIEVLEMIGCDPEAGDGFGHEVALQGRRAFVAAPFDEGATASDQGSVTDLLLSRGNFARFGFGDGNGAACPCANEIAPGLEQGCRNSTGHGAKLSIAGTDHASADGFYLFACNLLPGQPAMLFGGPDVVAGGAGLPFGNGLRVVGGGIRRHGLRMPDGEGIARWGPGIGGTQGWTAGQAHHFQVFYRDPLHATCVDTFNLTNGVSVLFEP